MRRVYLIQRNYIHYDTHGLVPGGVVAVFSSLAKASENALRLTEENTDPYVEYEVRAFPVC